MARDYLAIPATSCIAERSFSLSGRTDNPRRGQLKKTKFGGLQKIRAGYLDGRLNVEGDLMEKYLGDFTFDDRNTWSSVDISYCFIHVNFFETRARARASEFGPGPARPGPWTV